jgi:membrane protein implicated in regulation of membrane protease activity
VSFLSSLLAWANAPFTVALGVAVGFALLQMSGLLGLVAGGGHGGDHDVDGGHEADVDHEVDAHVDAGGHADMDHDVDAGGDHDGAHDGGHDADHDADHDGDHEQAAQSPGVGHQILAGLGVGKVPLSIVWQTFAVAFGFAGIAANTVYLDRVGALPPVALAWAVPAALVFAYAVTRGVSRVIGRMVADPKQEATSRRQLVGHTGVVISSKIDAEFGEVRLRDKTGHVVRIICRTRDEGRSIAEGREVVIVDYDRDRDRLYVAPLDEDDEPPERGTRRTA